MASTRFNVTASPSRITPLTADTVYGAQVIGPHPVHYASVTGTDEPTDLNTYGLALPRQAFPLAEETGESIWVWSPYGDTAITVDSVK